MKLIVAAVAPLVIASSMSFLISSSMGFSLESPYLSNMGKVPFGEASAAIPRPPPHVNNDNNVGSPPPPGQGQGQGQGGFSATGPPPPATPTEAGGTPANKLHLPSEVTLQQALKTLLSKPELSDLTLKANDGTLIKVQRAMLAARSPVFYNMLYGEQLGGSKSASSHPPPLIELKYSGGVLKALVHYMYTDEAPFLNEENIKPNLTKEEAENMVKNMGSLIDASVKYALTGLCEKAIAFAEKMIEKHPYSSIFWLALCDKYTDLMDSSLEKTAFQQIQRKPQMLLEGGTVGTLSASRIERILKCDTIDADEFMLFNILWAWTDSTKRPPSAENSSNSSEGTTDRKRKAMDLIKHVSLESIDPTELASTVANSGLVSTEQLLDAYKLQALAAKEQHGISYDKMFAPYVWKSSDDTRFIFPPGRKWTELLNCEPLIPGGVYKWSILVEELTHGGYYLEMGVVSSVHPIDPGLFLSSHGGSLVILSTGVWYSCWANDGASEDLRLKAGCQVHFTLDFTGAGSLLVSVDNKDPVMLNSNMLSLFDDTSRAGFVPAVSFSTEDDQKCIIKFLGFDSILHPNDVVGQQQ